MNPSIENCLAYLAGDDAVYKAVTEELHAVKESVSTWNWESGSDAETVSLLKNSLTLILYDLVTGDKEVRKLKITVLGQLQQLDLNDQVQEQFEAEYDKRCAPYASEIFSIFESESLDGLLPMAQSSKVLTFKRAPQPFIDSFHSIAAHSGVEDSVMSPIPPIELVEDYALYCAFPDPGNYNRVWFELRKDGNICPDAADHLKIAGQTLNIASGECEAQLSSDEVSQLIEGELSFQLNMTLD